MRLINRTKLRMKPKETTYYRPDSAQDSLERRLALLGLFIVAAFCVLLARLWFMQIVGGTDYKKMAEGNRIRDISLEAPRGSILDRNGKVLVRNRSALTVSVVPAELQNDSRVIERLSKLLGTGEKEIAYRIEQSQAPNQRAVLIKSDVSEDIVTYVREHQREFPGVIAGTRPVREYPHEALAAHVVGYLGEISPEILADRKGEGYLAGDEIGLSGVEATYDEDLRGEVGKYRLEVDAFGNAIRVISHKEPRSGNDLKLTIDQDIQAVVENALDWQMEGARSRYDKETGRNYAASGGSAVVLDPTNGEVIAMASLPNFDLNDFVGGISQKAWEELNDPDNEYPLNNRAIMSELPPGSTFKVVTALAGLSEPICTPDSTFDCQGVFTRGAFKQFPKDCWTTHGHLDLFRGIAQSCDIVFYELGNIFYERQGTGEGTPLWEYAKKYQMGKRTGIDLISEMDGRVPTPEWKKEFNKKNPEYQVWYPGDTVNLAIGQGDMLSTPLQIAYLYAGIANHGKFMKPHLLKSLEDEEGAVVRKADVQTAAELDAEPAVLDFVERSLVGVVHGKGTAAATFEGFPLGQIPVAGKTGTSEIVGKQTTAWFVGYAPVGNPRYVVAVAIEEGGHGGECAAPVARRILEGLFNLEPQGEIRPSVGD